MCTCTYISYVLVCVCGKAIQILVPLTFTIVGQNLGQLKLCILCLFSAWSLFRSPGWFIYEDAQSQIAPSSVKQRERFDAEIRFIAFNVNTLGTTY